MERIQGCGNLYYQVKVLSFFPPNLFLIPQDNLAEKKIKSSLFDENSEIHVKDKGTYLGLVAVLPIGMAQVSSCNITAEVGATLHKGEEFGYFLFGGSDIIVMFEAKSNVSICAEPNVHYNQGKTIAYFGKPCPNRKNPCPPPIKEPCQDKTQN